MKMIYYGFAHNEQRINIVFSPHGALNMGHRPVLGTTENVNKSLKLKMYRSHFPK